ncbi:MAG: hypothetical protein EXX96DRAFT_602437 [Benjaminiella poitrasii]|nr:MAG: hypothetical protein EXX96DRAFT_602437 [Benjaminiella poitrasii]
MYRLCARFRCEYRRCSRASPIAGITAIIFPNRLTTHRQDWLTAPAGSTAASSSSLNESYICSSSNYDDSYALSSSSGRDLNDTSSISPSLSALSTTKAKLNKYIEMCKDKANKHEFNLQTEIHQVLVSQFCAELIRYIDAESLLGNIQSDVINKDIKVDTGIYMELATLLRDIDNGTDRRALNIELNKLYEKATKENGMIIQIFVNLATKLLEFQRFSPVGELELTVNFLDPILSHIFHCPDSNKLLVLDAAMVALPQKAENPLDAQSDLELAFIVLIRLSTFARSLMLRKSSRKVLVIQCVGYTMVFYLVSEYSDSITQMAEILTIDIPKDITEINGLLQNIDNLKRLFLLYDHQLKPQYINFRASGDDPRSAMETINPKRRKKRIPSFSLV